MSAHENLEHAEHAEHAAHSNKKIALLIAVLALFLAFSETLGKSAQTDGDRRQHQGLRHLEFLPGQDHPSDQPAHCCRSDGRVQLPAITNDESKAAITKQIETWQETVTRYESDPKEQDGRKELRAMAEKFEHDRDTGSRNTTNTNSRLGAFRSASCLASAAVITGIVALAWSGEPRRAFLALIFMAVGLLAPHALHLAAH